MFCPYCGNQTPNGAAFCTGCGKQLPVIQPQPQAQPNPVQQAPVQQPVYQAPTPQQAPVQEPVYQASAQQPIPQAPIQQPVYQAPAQTNFAQQVVAGGAAVAKSTKTRLFVLIPLITILIGAIVFAGLYFFKSDEDKIRDRLDTFATACNDGDIEDMMECLDKKTRKYYETSMSLVEGLLGGITGFDLPVGDMFELFGMQEMGGQMNMEITVNSIQINGNTATVNITMSESGHVETDEIKMCKEDDDWFIDLEGTTGQSLSFY